MLNTNSETKDHLGFQAPDDNFADNDKTYIDPADMEHPEDDLPVEEGIAGSLFSQKYGSFENPRYIEKKLEKERDKIMYNPDTINYSEYNQLQNNRLNYMFDNKPPTMGGFNNFYYNQNPYAPSLGYPQYGNYNYGYNPYQRSLPYGYGFFNSGDYYDNKFQRALSNVNQYSLGPIDPGYYIDENGETIFVCHDKNSTRPEYKPYSSTINNGVYIKEGYSFFDQPVVVPSDKQLIEFEKKFCNEKGVVNPGFTPKTQTDYMVYDYKVTMEKSNILRSLAKSAANVSGTELTEEQLSYFDPLQVCTRPIHPYQENLTEEEKKKKQINRKMVERAARIAMEPRPNQELISRCIEERSARVSEEYRQKFPQDMSMHDFLASAGSEYARCKLRSVIEKQRDGRQLYNRESFKNYILSNSRPPGLNPKDLSAMGYNVEISPGLTLRADGTMEVKAPDHIKQRLQAYKDSFANKLEGGGTV